MKSQVVDVVFFTKPSPNRSTGFKDVRMLKLATLNYKLGIFRGSSMVEQETVNFKVLGSNHSRGARYFSPRNAFS